ncbi:exosome complex component RRP41-like [Sycon ciliatum]|uniref:exosome complex component RRP41-like n=1 Tax=Sycon ciliatum TaxID=27933 RepID=UPI0020AD148A|eukprot:scpid86644/ scgid19725/ Exosome complex component RRP41; Exosome component 4; Ribosomal RNA-processing protein 41
MAGLEYLSPEDLRLDGRKAPELRKLNARLGVFQQSDGSAYLEQGSTMVLATVNGPHESMNRSRASNDTAFVNCQFSMATFSTSERRRRTKGDRRSTEMSQFIQDTFEAAILTHLYPRCQIDIYVQIMQAGGGHLAACINAASLAVMDAGIPTKDLVCACTTTLVKETAIVDVTYLEESAGPLVTMAMLARSGSIILTQMEKRLHVDQLSALVESGTKGCKDVSVLLSVFLRTHITDQLAVQGVPQ